MPPKGSATYQLSDSEDELFDDELFDSDFEDELEPDGQGAVKKDKKPRKKQASDIAAILKGSLSEPIHSSITCKHIHDLVHMGEAKLNPDYQREVVWPEVKMIGLIQSIFMNYYIPPILFSKHIDPVTTETTYICMDGKQRCTSILYFMDGKIPFVSPATKERFYYNKAIAKSKRGNELPQALRTRFDMHKLQVGEYLDLREEQQRDIFQRVQLGVALSAAEKLAALAGPWAKWLSELQKKYITEPGTLESKLDYDTKRSKAYQAVVAFVMLAQDSTNQLKPSPPTMKSFLDRADPPEEGFKDRVAMALGFFVNIATNHYEAAFGTIKKRVAPVEFWFISYFIYLRMGFLSLERLAMHIGEMRRVVHTKYPGEVKANANVMTLLRNEIAKVPKKRQNGEQPAAEEYERDEGIDARDQRALKKARKEMDHDPTYMDDGIERIPGNTDLTTTTRSRAATTVDNSAAVPAQPSASTASREVRPLPRQSSSGGTPLASHAQTRPPTLQNIPPQNRPSPVFNNLPTPQSSSPYQVYNQNPVQVQQQPQTVQYAPVQQNGAHTVNPYGQPQNQQAAYTTQPQANYSAQANYRPQTQARPQPQSQQVTWVNGQPMTAEQHKQYTQQRLQAQIALASHQQQQQQQQQQQYDQNYGR